jgi:hypothetical protein
VLQESFCNTPTVGALRTTPKSVQKYARSLKILRSVMAGLTHNPPGSGVLCRGVACNARLTVKTNMPRQFSDTLDREYPKTM